MSTPDAVRQHTTIVFMDRRQVANRVGVLLVAAILVGALAALLWGALSQVPSFTVATDGHATMAELGMSTVVSADWWFSVLGLAIGLALGIAVWVLLRGIGWPVALICVGVALLSALTCWLLGEALGPSSFAARITAAQPGDLVAMDLQLHAWSALAVWPFAAVAVPLFAASLGPELDRRAAAADSVTADA